jgi:hypothetical protein
MTQATAFTQLPDEVQRDIDLKVQLELEGTHLKADNSPVRKLNFTDQVS